MGLTSRPKPNSITCSSVPSSLPVPATHPGSSPSPPVGAFLPPFSRTWGALVGVEVSLPLQLCNFSNTFPLKTLLRQKWEAAAHGGERGSHGLGTTPEEAAPLSHARSLCSPRCVLPSEEGWRQEQQGNPQIAYIQRSQMDGKQRPPGRACKMWHPASQWGWSDEKPFGCLPDEADGGTGQRTTESRPLRSPSPSGTLERHRRAGSCGQQGSTQPPACPHRPPRPSSSSRNQKCPKMDWVFSVACSFCGEMSLHTDICVYPPTHSCSLLWRVPGTSGAHRCPQQL